MNDGPGYFANLQRGELLRHQGRYADAEKYLQQAISQDPSNAEGYYQLAFCYCNWTGFSKGHTKKALEIIDRAIALDPSRHQFYALRSWVLANLKKYKEAVQVADQALGINPESVLALNAKARAYRDLSDWKQAEATSRFALSIDPANEFAANLLAIALRQQGRLRESEEITALLLAQVPDNPMAQSNAGWSALQAGDHQRANRHFMEALRLDPNDENARRGLLHSFNSRVWIYRLYFQFIAWLSKHRTETRYFFIFIVYVVYRLVVTELRTQFGKEGVHWAIVVIALYLVIFGFGRSFANLFLLLDPYARFSLSRKEMCWSVVAGLLYGLFLTVLIADNAWPQAAFLIAILVFFLWGVLFPRIQGAFTREAQPD